MISNLYASHAIRLARVTHVFPEAQKMSVVFLDNGDVGHDVQLLSPYAGSDFGFTSGIPAPEQEGREENMTNDPDRRTIVVAVASVAGASLALGYLHPQVSQLAMTKDTDKNRLIERHTSDAYRTISDDGDMDFVHPGGVYIRIGEGDTPDDLTGRDFDGRWALKRNTGKAPTVTISGPSYKFTLKHDGSAKLETDGPVDVQSQGAVSVDAQGAVSVATQSTAEISSMGPTTITSASGSVAIAAAGLVGLAGAAIALSGQGGGAAPATMTGDFTIIGSLHVTGSVTCDSDVTVDGNVAADGDVTADGVSLHNHVHPHVTPGGSDSDPPKTE